MNACSKTGDPRRRIALLLVAWVTLACACARAQSGSPTVAATLQDPVVDVGEATRYQITVVDGQADRPPAPPVLAGLTFQYVGEENHRSFYLDSRSGARTVSSLVYNYTVRAGRAGRYTIPGQEVLVGGVALRTLPIALTVQDSGTTGTTPPSQTVSSELILTKKSAYVGEGVPVEVRSYFGTDVRRQPDIDVQLDGDGLSVQKFTPPQSTQQLIDGIHYNVIFYKSAVTGLKTGRLTVGPAETNPVVQLPAQGPRHRQSNGFNPFDGFFGGSLLQPPTRIKMRTEPATLEVRPLPAGKPADFSGGIGQFKLDVEAEPRRALAGDPVTVRLILSGQGNFDRVNAPTLADERGLKVYPPKGKFKADDDVGLSGVKTFDQVVIADGARASLPAYRFNYLDPETGKYMSLDTPPVAVRIEGSVAPPATPSAPVASLGPAPSASVTASPPPTPARVAEDILYIRSDPGVARDRSAFLPVYERRGFWWAQGLAAATLALVAAGIGWRVRRQNAAAGGRAARAREQAELHARLRTESTTRRDFYLAATRLAQLRSGAGKAAGALTAAEIAQARRLDAGAAGSVQEIFRRHDELAYSGGQVALEPVPADERRGVLATLETLSNHDK